MLQRIIQLREPQRAKLTPHKNARHFLKINKMKISVGLFLKPIVFHSSSWFYKRREYREKIRQASILTMKCLEEQRKQEQ